MVVFIFLLINAIGTYQAVSLQSNSIDDIYNNRFKGYQQSSQILVDMSSVQTKLFKIMNWVSSNYDKKRIEELTKQIDAEIVASVERTQKILNSKNLMPEEKKVLSNHF